MDIISKISENLDLDINFIKSIAEESDTLYRIYKIPKKNGNKRTIFHPTSKLKAIQYWLTNNVFNKLSPSNFSYAYTKGCSIKENALYHKKSIHILHLDIKNFFQSIKDTHLENVLEKISKYTPEEISFIKNISLYKNHLVIGSLSSPIISNLVMLDFDNKLSEVLKNKYNIDKYSRYADDLIISSSNKIPADVVDCVQDNLKPLNLQLNTNKTKFMSKKGKRMITGLVIHKEKISIGTWRKKYIKKLLYNKLTKNIGDSKQILGYLYFLKDIEEDYFNKLIIKYSKFGNVLDILKKDSNQNEVFDLF